MESSLTNQEWYTALIDDCRAIITEAVHNSRWDLLTGHWQVGERVRTDIDWQKWSQDSLYNSQDLANAIGISERTLNYCLQAYDKYPTLDLIPDGKNISWTKLITKYLTTPKENEFVTQLPEGKFNTIVIDPPWPMEFIQLEMRPNQVEMPYKTMSIDEIKALPIKDKASDNCNLFLWTTHKFLPDSFDILKSWGFEYHVCLTWDKTNGRSLFGFNRRTEFCLYGHNGKITVNQRGKFIDTVFTEKLREHSRKPIIFDDLLRSNTPEPRLEWFSREKKEGFVTIGDEPEKYGSPRVE